MTLDITAKTPIKCTARNGTLVSWEVCTESLNCKLNSGSLIQCFERDTFKELHFSVLACLMKASPPDGRRAGRTPGKRLIIAEPCTPNGIVTKHELVFIEEFGNYRSMNVLTTGNRGKVLRLSDHNTTYHDFLVSYKAKYESMNDPDIVAQIFSPTRVVAMHEQPSFSNASLPAPSAPQENIVARGVCENTNMDLETVLGHVSELNVGTQTLVMDGTEKILAAITRLESKESMVVELTRANAELTEMLAKERIASQQLTAMLLTLLEPKGQQHRG